MQVSDAIATQQTTGPRSRWSTKGGHLVTIAVSLSTLLLVFGGFYIALPWSSQASAYLTDRNIGLAALTMALLITRSTRSLAAVLLGSAFIHLLDGIVDVPAADYAGVAGSLIFAGICAAAAAWLLRPPVVTPTA